MAHVDEIKLKPREGLAAFLDGITPPLAALGFVPADVKGTFSRTLESTVIHEIALNQGTRDIRPDVALGQVNALGCLRVAAGKREVLPRMGLEYLYYGGWIPGVPWKSTGARAFNHEICHASCVAKSVKRFMAEMKRYAQPFFAKHEDVGAVADFFTRDATYSEARPNWTIDREALLGAAERFWRADRALLLEVAVGAVARPKEASRLLADAQRREKTWKKKKLHGWTPELAKQLTALGEALGA